MIWLLWILTYYKRYASFWLTGNILTCTVCWPSSMAQNYFSHPPARLPFIIQRRQSLKAAYYCFHSLHIVVLIFFPRRWRRSDVWSCTQSCIHSLKTLRPQLKTKRFLLLNFEASCTYFCLTDLWHAHQSLLRILLNFKSTEKKTSSVGLVSLRNDK